MFAELLGKNIKLFFTDSLLYSSTHSLDQHPGHAPPKQRKINTSCLFLLLGVDNQIYNFIK